MRYEGFKISKESVDKVFPKKDIDITGWESPIDVVMGQMRISYDKWLEDNTIMAIQEYGITVDKDELIKALQYDRNQYNKGFANGYNKGASDVAREIFKEIDTLIVRRMIPDIAWIDDRFITDIAKLKKKYLGEDINAPTKESEGEGNNEQSKG